MEKEKRFFNEISVGTWKGGLKKGYTTGSCGTAAALAAAFLLFLGEKWEKVSFRTPNNTLLEIKIESWEQGENWARCAVKKFAGDDPDVTDGILIYACVSWGKDRRFSEQKQLLYEKEASFFRQGQLFFEKEREECGKEKLLGVPSLQGECREAYGDRWYVEEMDGGAFTLYLRGGEGIGRVTRAGLSCPVGMWAINPVPRQMIFSQVALVCRKAQIFGPVWITLEIPEGRQRAEKTFNSRLGIVGGLSVLGTSGIVEPMSEPALLETIRLEIVQQAAEGERCLLLTPGNYGEFFLSEKLGIPLERTVKCSNYIGDALDIAAEVGMEKLLLVGHGGKLIKLAAGVMNTHSRVADGRMECLAAYGAVSGASKEMAEKILDCLTVEEALDVLGQEKGLKEETVKRIMERISCNLNRRTGGKSQAEAIVFTNKWEILGMTKGAQEMLKLFVRSNRDIR